MTDVKTVSAADFMGRIEPEAVRLYADSDEPLTLAVQVSTAVSLKRIADRLEGATILPGESSDEKGQVNVGADVRNHY